MIHLHLIDNLKYSKDYPDQYFHLVDADPPYFSGPEKRGYYGKKNSTTGVERRSYPITETWELPNVKWFKEMQRVSKNQIIWGGNYFDFIGKPFKTPRGNEIEKFIEENPKGWIIWDKCNGKTSFNDYELAWTSFDRPTLIFKFMWNGMMQGRSIYSGHIQQGNKRLNQHRIHPTEKPIMLYDWQFSEYTNSGDKVLSPYGGSFSDAISASKFDIEFHGCEISKPIYNKALKRFKNHQCQLQLF